jgi:ribosomal protein S19
MNKAERKELIRKIATRHRSEREFEKSIRVNQKRQPVIDSVMDETFEILRGRGIDPTAIKNEENYNSILAF